MASTSFPTHIQKILERITKDLSTEDYEALTKFVAPVGSSKAARIDAVADALAEAHHKKLLLSPKEYRKRVRWRLVNVLSRHALREELVAGSEGHDEPFGIPSPRGGPNLAISRQEALLQLIERCLSFIPSARARQAVRLLEIEGRSRAEIIQAVPGYRDVRQVTYEAKRGLAVLRTLAAVGVLDSVLEDYIQVDARPSRWRAA